MKDISTSSPLLDTRKIVITGVLAAIAILLGITRLGFIPVPNISGNATIMHVPAIIGGVMEGPVVGLLVGLIFGIFSWLQATNPMFADPIVAVLPRLFIGVTAYYSYALFKNWNEYVALVVAAVVGTLTNTILVLGAIVLRGYLPVEALIPIIPQAIAEVIIAVVITVTVVMAWKRLEKGSGKSSI
ncbi:MAG: ECF transporter S component [Anaerolineae bacterium]|nr:ECF transporter S component [Anaerolineae bacterium]